MARKQTNVNEALVEASKELIRIALVAVIPVAIVQIQAGSVDVKQLGVIASLAILKAIDKFVHSWDGTTKTGILPI